MASILHQIDFDDSAFSSFEIGTLILWKPKMFINDVHRGRIYSIYLMNNRWIKYALIDLFLGSKLRDRTEISFSLALQT